LSKNNFTVRTDLEKARASALASLSMREHSVKELTDKLSNKGYEPESIQIVIKECLENNYLNDDRFAEIYCRSRAQKGYGPLKISMELKLKGITENQAKNALQQDGLDFYQIVEYVYMKKYRETPIADFKEKMKRQNYLYRRGFDFDLISHVIN
jgi:regulatory protein